MASMEQFTDEELQAEMNKREVERRAAPKARMNPEMNSYRNFCHYMEKYADRVAEGNLDEDDVHYIYEEACKLVFGDKFFDWYNSVSK